MAEVRKKTVENKYNVSVPKKENKNKIEKKHSDNSKKVNETNEKKSLKVRFLIFCNGVRSEFNKVHWTSKSDMIKYSIATIFFIIFCSGFFYLIDILFAFVRSLFS